ncbi:hypothetical protein DDJ31_22290 [Streptomyces griseoviridis]|uniref:Uncharacterized protein n=1 Tax=Streptomyces griseoviridis TaxID=45398 RepID=A0A6G5SJ46_STRGD|nr:hypothetical protein DDJ31_22290 [Streptomyces griseoviridis]
MVSTAEWLSGDRPESALTSDSPENITYGVQACQLAVPPGSGAYSRPHDNAYVHPAVVGRLTAAVLTYALNGRRLGGRSRLSLRSLGEPAGQGGGLDQEVEWR